LEWKCQITAHELIEIDYSFRTKLEELSDDEEIELLKSSIINGREGFFALSQTRVDT
jgi:transposase